MINNDKRHYDIHVISAWHSCILRYFIFRIISVVEIEAISRRVIHSTVYCQLQPSRTISLGQIAYSLHVQ